MTAASSATVSESGYIADDEDQDEASSTKNDLPESTNVLIKATASMQTTTLPAPMPMPPPPSPHTPSNPRSPRQPECNSSPPSSPSRSSPHQPSKSPPAKFSPTNLENFPAPTSPSSAPSPAFAALAWDFPSLYCSDLGASAKSWANESSQASGQKAHLCILDALPAEIRIIIYQYIIGPWPTMTWTAEEDDPWEYSRGISRLMSISKSVRCDVAGLYKGHRVDLSQLVATEEGRGGNAPGTFRPNESMIMQQESKALSPGSGLNKAAPKKYRYRVAPPWSIFFEDLYALERFMSSTHGMVDHLITSITVIRIGGPRYLGVTAFDFHITFGARLRGLMMREEASESSVLGLLREQQLEKLGELAAKVQMLVLCLCEDEYMMHREIAAAIAKGGGGVKELTLIDAYDDAYVRETSAYNSRLPDASTYHSVNSHYRDGEGERPSRPGLRLRRHIMHQMADRSLKGDRGGHLHTWEVNGPAGGAGENVEGENGKSIEPMICVFFRPAESSTREGAGNALKDAAVVDGLSGGKKRKREDDGVDRDRVKRRRVE
ncbi:MAG: hypothetical protein M1831_002822 [Alyxoria varia]|nr:MAG: hypothetical protein M1831_002822 [Alyxoria varia]